MGRQVWWLDLNETLVRTGEVALSDRLAEQVELEAFRDACMAQGASGGLDLVWVTGNTWEYARRVEEPLGLQRLPGVRMWVISENGLLARAMPGRLLWRASPCAGWADGLDQLFDRLRRDRTLQGAWVRQANEVRETLKPVANRFTPAQLAQLAEHVRAVGLPGRCWVHPFYVDLDPDAELDGAPMQSDKAGAAQRLLASGEVAAGEMVAVGDSGSDVGLLDLVRGLGGQGWLVANAPPELRPDLPRTTAPFTAGVVEAVAHVAQRCPRGLCPA